MSNRGALPIVHDRMHGVRCQRRTPIRWPAYFRDRLVDSLTTTYENQAGPSYNGSIDWSNGVSGTITFTGLEPVDMSGSPSNCASASATSRSETRVRYSFQCWIRNHNVQLTWLCIF